jgi:hypothetical protein
MLKLMFRLVGFNEPRRRPRRGDRHALGACTRSLKGKKNGTTTYRNKFEFSSGSEG